MTPAHFDDMFAHDDDPWKFRSRWYEARKRAITMACLPEPRYRRAFEPGCANGELSALLADRCDSLLASDGSPRAVKIARQRLAGLDHVRVAHGWMPADWPDERFDLIVVSELGYFLSAADLELLIARIKSSLDERTTVLACHWRPRIHGCALDGDAVHQRLDAELGLPHLSRIVEADFRLDVWSRDPRSVGEREGLA